MLKFLGDKIEFSKGEILMAVGALAWLASSFAKDYDGVVHKAGNLGKFLVEEKGVSEDDLKDIAEGKYKKEE